MLAYHGDEPYPAPPPPPLDAAALEKAALERKEGEAEIVD